MEYLGNWKVGGFRICIVSKARSHAEARGKKVPRKDAKNGCLLLGIRKKAPLFLQKFEIHRQIRRHIYL